MNQIPDWDELVRHVTGEESAQAPEHFSPETSRAIHIMRDAVALTRDLPTPPKPALARAELMAKLPAESLSQPLRAQSMPQSASRERNTRIASIVGRISLRSSLRPHTLRYALASAVLCVVCLTVGWYSGTKHSSASNVSTFSTYTTGNGQQATITLSDGSTVLLNVGSRLEVPTNYADGNRTLQLRGEALFTVNHHSGSPFTVVAGSSVTRVLGTRFVVRRYATDSVASVAVSHGKVAVGSTVLVENQEVAVSDLATGDVRQADPAKFSFATGSLKLNAMPLRDAVLELSRWYDADIRLGDSSLAARRVTGECITGSLADLAEFLELTFDIRVERIGRVLTLYPKG